MARPPTVSSSRTYLRAAGAGTALLATAVLGACSGSSSGGGPAAPPHTETTIATVTHSASGSSGVSSGSSTPAPRTSPRSTASSASDGGGSTDSGNNSGSTTAAYCKESQLLARIDPQKIPGNNRNGERAVIIDIVNKSNSTCVLYGYPGAAIVASSGKQVKQAKRTIRGRLLGFAPGHNTLPRVVLGPGRVATAGIEGTDQQEYGAAQAGCDNPPYPRILVTPPNTRIPVPFTVTWPICYSFTVHPVNYHS